MRAYSLGWEAIAERRPAAGPKLNALTVVDTRSRISPMEHPPVSRRDDDGVATLRQVCAEVGLPEALLVDASGELVSRDLDLRAYRQGVVPDFARSKRRPPGTIGCKVALSLADLDGAAGHPS